MTGRIGAGLLLVVGFACQLFVPPSRAQAGDDCSQQQEYENHNQIDPRPLKVSDVSGAVIDIVKVPVEGACVLLFSEQSHELLARAVADPQGHFHLTQVKAGRYRLVVKEDGFCAANVPLSVSASAGKKKIMVYMRPRGIDSCSHGELK